MSERDFSGFYRLTQAVENPNYDGRVKHDWRKSTKVFPAGMEFAVRQMLIDIDGLGHVPRLYELLPKRANWSHQCLTVPLAFTPGATRTQKNFSNKDELAARLLAAFQRVSNRIHTDDEILKAAEGAGPLLLKFAYALRDSGMELPLDLQTMLAAGIKRAEEI
jgi:hypothetical protein